MAYETLLIEIDDHVGVIKLNRPDALNAFNNQLMEELTAAVDEFESNEDIGCIVITGSNKVFAAGADIKEMQSHDYMSAYSEDFITRNWERVSRCRKPVIAAVAGYALGGGCELAMMCDMIIASEKAKFGQPEINLGVAPGMGGSQRLTKAIGKSKAMALLLTGDFIDARKACDVGIVAEVTADGQALPTALAMASRIAANSPLAVALAKDAALASFETPLAQGLEHEKRNFFVVLRSADNLEGQAAFLDKRAPNFTGQ